ncbi:hypothetical protein V8F20_000690 [Naviculisporaceae sp. PSN 640]
MSNIKRYEQAHQVLSSLHGDELQTRFLELFPDKEGRRGYIAWDVARLDAMEPPELSAPAFINVIDTKGLIQESRALELAIAMIESRPLVPVGSDNKFLYRLLADPYSLVSQDKNTGFFSKDGKNQRLIDRHTLGVNTTVQPRLPAVPLSRRKQNLSEESTGSSAESDDHNQAPGWIFYQLGELQATQYNWKNNRTWSQSSVREALDVLKEREDTEMDVWTNTGFNLVARLDNNTGRCAGIYAIFNMCPENPQTYYREQITHDKWGFLPSGEHFAVARISRSLGELGYLREMKWDEKIEHPVELVRVRPAGNPLGAIRQTVDKSTTAL